MRNILLAAGVAALAISAPVLAQGRGHGEGHGKSEARGDRGGGGGGARGNGRGNADARPGRESGPRDAPGQGRGRGGEDRQARAERPGGGPGNAENRGRGAERRMAASRGPDDRGRGPDARPDRNREDRGRNRGPDRVRDDRGPRGQDERARRFANGREGRWGRIDRRPVVIAEPVRIVRAGEPRRRGFVDGCPPGLARRDNGCLPPGLARQLAAERSWYGGWWPQRDSGAYRYNDGYLYRMRPDGLVSGFLPVAGGALWAGNAWPANYAYDPVPAYYPAYYGYEDPYDYRYADGVLYGLDPQTSMIEQVAALLTGDSWSVGSRMPDGYGVYNVPYGYRDRYADTADEWYRYNDGYIYQVDPTTQLVQAAIQLLT